MALATGAAWAGLCTAQTALWFAVAPVDLKGGVAARYEWAARCTESFHAATISLAAATWLVRRRARVQAAALFAEVAANAALPLSELDGLAWLGEIMAGYLVFDTVYELSLPFVRHRGDARKWPSTKPDLAFLAHHVVGLAAHVAALRCAHVLCWSYAPYVYLAEFSTPFLHASWMLKQKRRSASPLFLANGAIGAACFLAFRVMLAPRIVLHLAADRAGWAGHPGGTAAHSLFLGALVVFVGLNCFWFTKLVKLMRDAAKPPPKRGD
ncbi:TRAM/LAG1/CLN8 homology domain-containing protein [Pelagophyceae sp. CCMP2097]|nr:TRAM/LAG1/CLN8 homology domain-containing protein [Pelagophyceae sp. CCMP2097]|mmetsp:Transcript_13685/g.45651  ORF Transcript_13685/g.45651 Transcript_13685/m.45651 type:complete len:268 (+) Transcript_13685:138-941(+)